MNGGKKYDDGKLQWRHTPWDWVKGVVAATAEGIQVCLIPFEAIRAIGQVITFGAKKYGANNWQTLPDFKDRYSDALMRHFVAWQGGEEIDQESGLHHLAHIGCNTVFLLWWVVKNPRVSGDSGLRLPPGSSSREIREALGWIEAKLPTGQVVEVFTGASAETPCPEAHPYPGRGPDTERNTLPSARGQVSDEAPGRPGVW